MKAMGKAGSWSTSIAVAFQCYGAGIAYLVLISSTAPVVGKATGLDLDPVVLQIIITGVIVAPLCMLKSLNSLAASAIFALIVYLVVAITAMVGTVTDTWYEDV